MLTEINSVIELVLKVIRIVALIAIGVAAVAFITSIFVAVSTLIFIPAVYRVLLVGFALFIVLARIFKIFAL